MSIKVRPAILIIENHKVLTMKYLYGGQEVYNLPGGNLELGEYLSEALAREMVEELGISVEVGELILIGEVHSSNETQNKQTLHLLFEGKITEGVPTLNPKETSALDIQWLSVNDLENINLYPNLTIQIKNFLASKLQNKYIGKINQPWF
jgi:8-oxo-dGTP diphosphatase